MKQYISTILALTCAVLIVALFVIKGGDNAQREKDASTIADFSNQLDSAQTDLDIRNGTILTLSNSLSQSQSVSVNFSNRLAASESAHTLDAGQISNLTRRVAASESEAQSLGRRVTELTNQVAGLTNQIAVTESKLAQAHKDYALLENRLRRDVAERVIVERRFNNPSELQTQMQYLKTHPAGIISADSIYAGLGVEVTSNAFHAISPN